MGSKIVHIHPTTCPRRVVSALQRAHRLVVLTGDRFVDQVGTGPCTGGKGLATWILETTWLG